MGTISGWSVDVSNTILIGEDDGIVLLDVDATFNQIEIHHDYSSSDLTSVGLRAVW